MPSLTFIYLLSHLFILFWSHGFFYSLDHNSILLLFIILRMLQFFSQWLLYPFDLQPFLFKHCILVVLKPILCFSFPSLFPQGVVVPFSREQYQKARSGCQVCSLLPLCYCLQTFSADIARKYMFVYYHIHIHMYSFIYIQIYNRHRFITEPCVYIFAYVNIKIDISSY